MGATIAAGAVVFTSHPSGVSSWGLSLAAARVEVKFSPGAPVILPRLVHIDGLRFPIPDTAPASWVLKNVGGATWQGVSMNRVSDAYLLTPVLFLSGLLGLTGALAIDKISLKIKKSETKTSRGALLTDMADLQKRLDDET